MPTVFRKGTCRFSFFSGDRDEMPHLYMERELCEPKFWLDPVRLARSHYYQASELFRNREARREIQSRYKEFIA